MERNKKTRLLFLLLALFCVGAVRENCPNVPNNFNTDLTCYSDYNRVITCAWNSTSDPPNNVCTLNAERKSRYSSYNSSCTLQNDDVSGPTLKKCSMTFKKDGNFQTNHELSINLSCHPVKQNLSTVFKPACHIKLNPPRQPDINLTAVSWFPQVTKHGRLSYYSSQLQWKHQNQPWTENNNVTIQCKWSCQAELDPDWLMQGERYEARIRVKAIETDIKSAWSEWSPNTSWVSPIGRKKPVPSDLSGGLFGGFAAAAAFAMLLVIIRFKTHKTTWVYMVKRIRGPPLPNPANSFLQDANFQTWLSPHFSSESFRSLFKPVEVVSVEVTSAVNAVAPGGQEVALLEKFRSESSYESTSSNFSNPSYSQLCPPPVSSLTAGNLAPCTADTPYGPVGCQGDRKYAEQDVDEEGGKEVEEIHLLLYNGSNDGESLPVISDYEKVEGPQVERVRLQSLDSGVCSGEEVSQESLEADSITVTDEGPEGEEDSDPKQVQVQKLPGHTGGIFGSIQVCSGYEQDQKLQANSPELPSLDSGVGSVCEELVSQEDVDKSPPPPSAFLTPQTLNFSGPGVSPALRPLPSPLLERIVLMAANRPVEPSGGGYLPLRNEDSL